MANDAFALSPISARAALPSEDDYQAISDAFMETSRGRWFLTEYARRNRNADTAMVLEAVARIEASIATQKQVAASATLAEAGESMRGLVAQASAAAAEALDRFDSAHDAAPTQRGLRIIREVAWRLREVGYDSRICDIIEAQAATIDVNSAPRPTADLRAAVLSTFETLRREIDELAVPGGARAAPAAEAAPQATTRQAAAPEPQMSQPAAFDLEASQPEPSRPEVSQPESPLPEALVHEAPPPEVPNTPAQVAVDETVVETVPEPVAELPTPLPPEGDAPAALPDPQFDAASTPEAVVDEEIVLAPPPEHDHAPAGEDAPAVVAPAPEIVVAPAPEIDVVTADAVAAPPPQPASLRASPIPPNTLSLGESLLARGMVTSPASKADPLAPIRRMSQAEKIAFFS